MTLWVAGANAAACHLYEAHGFVRTLATMETTIGPVVEMAVTLPA